MLYLSFAIYAEAEPFIKKFKLKSADSGTGYQVYSSDEVKLIITGSGNIRSAINLTAYLENEAISPTDFFINIGSAAYFKNDIKSPSVFENSVKAQLYSCRNQVFICNKLKELSTAKSYYPDILFPHAFEEAICLTSPTPILKGFKPWEHLFEEERNLTVLCDMEGCSLYQAAVRYFKTHQMLFIKYASDTGISGNNEYIDIRPTDSVVEKLLVFLSNITRPTSLLSDTASSIKKKATKVSNELSALLSLSVTMSYQLTGLLTYHECGGYDCEKYAEEFKNANKKLLPTKKNEGKLLFEKLKTEILSMDAGFNVTALNANTQNSNGVLSQPFSHIYVQKDAVNYELTQKLLGKFSDRRIVYIDHYKDIFNRHGQDFYVQKQSQNLILSVNNSVRIYPGARTCQDFGHEHFYYTSQIKNCIYDCEYCYLQGMYPSGNINIFVNTEDYLNDARELLKKHPVSLSISYDTDMTALNGLTGLVEKWYELAKSEPELTIEIRTKCGTTALSDKLEPIPNVVFAFTLSPSAIAEKYEHNASDYYSRKNAIYKCLEKGFTTRLSFDPVLPVPGFEEIYTEMVDDVFSNPSASLLRDISIGSFRISKDYIKQMQDVRISRITTYPYSINDGICGFDEENTKRIMNVMKDAILKYIPESKLFIADT